MANGKPKLTNYDGKFLLCRYQRHQWKFLGFFRQEGQIVGGFQCRECKTVREQFIDRDGNMIGNTYHYPKGYTVKVGREGERIMPSDVRKEMVRRNRVYSNASDVLPSQYV